MRSAKIITTIKEWNKKHPGAIPYRHKDAPIKRPALRLTTHLLFELNKKHFYKDGSFKKRKVKNWKLVHGVPNSKDCNFEIHAWLELGNKIIDPYWYPKSVEKPMSKIWYYRRYKLRHQTVSKYTFREIKFNLDRFKTYGPWVFS